jgi:hypothetical protein
VGSQQILLGVAPGRVNTLYVLSEHVANGQQATGYGQTVDQTEATGAAPVGRPDFKAILKRSLGL